MENIKDGNIELWKLNIVSLLEFTTLAKKIERKLKNDHEHWSRNHKDEDRNDKDKQKTLFCTWSRYQVVAS